MNVHRVTLNHLRRACLGITLLGVVCSCVPAATTAPPAEMPDVENEPINDDVMPAPPVDADMPPDAEAQLTPLQAEAVSKAVRAASMTIGAAIAVQPATELAGYLDGTVALPDCPQVTLDADAVNVSPTLTYGTACAPDVFASTLLSGQATGQVYLAVAAFDMAGLMVAIGEESLSGSVSGGFTAQPNETTMAVNLDLQVADAEFRGSATVRIERNPPGATASTVTLSIPLSNGTDALAVYDGIEVDAASGPDLFPVGGSVRLDLPADNDTNRSQFELEFTPESAASKSVWFIIDGSEPQAITP